MDDGAGDLFGAVLPVETGFYGCFVVGRRCKVVKRVGEVFYDYSGLSSEGVI